MVNSNKAAKKQARKNNVSQRATSTKVFDGAKFNYKNFMVSDSEVVIKGIRSLLCYYSKCVNDVNELNFKSNDAKQKGVAALYIYTKKNLKNKKGSALEKDVSKFIKQVIDDKQDERLVRLRQKFNRAVMVMFNNNVSPKDAVDFVQKETLKNLYNGKTKTEAEKARKNSTTTFKQLRATLSKCVKACNVSSTDNYAIICYKGEYYYLSDKDIVKSIKKKNTQFEAFPKK